MTILEAHFDGTSIVLDEPFKITPNTKVKVLVDDKSNTERKSENMNRNKKVSFPKPIKTGIPDLSEQHDHYLYGTPKR
ncbi:MAG: hypothetical protein HYZ34_14205 [Ignavibacteriae bacterium]|nr:hypothetical protein [Ignavibacteriota bacterium]